jgi:hypothetical protein
MKRLAWVCAMLLLTTAVAKADSVTSYPCEDHSCTSSAACIDIGCLGGCDPWPLEVSFCAADETE